MLVDVVDVVVNVAVAVVVVAVVAADVAVIDYATVVSYSTYVVISTHKHNQNTQHRPCLPIVTTPAATTTTTTSHKPHLSHTRTEQAKKVEAVIRSAATYVSITK